MTARPRKPWRVTLTGPDVHATADHTSERNAYAFLLAALHGDSPATDARVDYWEGGRWGHYEDIHGRDLPPRA
ncbi:hypothetical protein OTB20_19515 [Streptomyces sp. H27-H1]|uniref:hypothetical protein n=1 Tax=Streptomyces sp. H27-H1 TaxID=2996461 RepID=UPI0022720DE8|nr:hypothetical protein [Streptomyces sp. H27-H1]MCY0928346.1 hypothetical protein [Streptomyces sp. H27-H1]